MQVSRIIGEYNTKQPGPLMVFIGGLHGNEVSGVQAIKDVFEQLEKHKPDIRGRVVGLAGNVKALELEKRFIDQDMNRVWLTDLEKEGINELHERDELIKAIGQIHDPNDEEVNFFDLHATSSPSGPFIMMSDTIRNRKLASMVKVPVVLGLLEHLHGMLMDVTSLSGIPTLLFQGGREGDDSTIENHKSFIWTALRNKSGLDLSTIPGTHDLSALLACKDPSQQDGDFLEIVEVFKIPFGKEFMMNPGYENFQSVKSGEVVAECNGRKVRFQVKGKIFMPLYQDQGREGFYIVRPIAPFWIRLSRGLRKFRHHNKLHWLVGVRKVARKPLTYRVDLQVTFMWAIQIFHLLGYTNIRRDGPFLFMTQREDEINPPTTAEAIDYFVNRSYLRNEIKEIESEWTIPFSGQNVTSTA